MGGGGGGGGGVTWFSLAEASTKGTFHFSAILLPLSTGTSLNKQNQDNSGDLCTYHIGNLGPLVRN